MSGTPTGSRRGCWTAIVDPDGIRSGVRHPRRLVRQRLDPCLRAARPAGRARRTASPMSTWKAPTSTAAGSIPRCCRPAARWAARPIAAVVTHGFTLDEKGMKMSKSLGNTVAAAGGDRAIRRRYPAALGGAGGLYRRPAHRAGNPEGHGRQLSPAAQHDALPAGRPGRVRPRPSGSRPTTCPSWSAGCCTGWPSSTRGAARATPPTTSRASSGRCSSSPRWICRRSISTSARTRFTATATARAAARRARCWTCCSTA